MWNSRVGYEADIRIGISQADSHGLLDISVGDSPCGCTNQPGLIRVKGLEGADDSPMLKVVPVSRDRSNVPHGSGTSCVPSQGAFVCS
jgi:hypothetical protein